MLNFYILIKKNEILFKTEVKQEAVNNVAPTKFSIRAYVI